jgi:3-carboxy-cis,cis-muconate cycloisomerase
VLASGADLATTLAHDPDVAGEFDVPRLRELLDPARYVGEAGAVVDRVVARAENVLFVGGVSKA